MIKAIKSIKLCNMLSKALNKAISTDYERVWVAKYSIATTLFGYELSANDSYIGTFYDVSTLTNYINNN